MNLKGSICELVKKKYTMNLFCSINNSVLYLLFSLEKPKSYYNNMKLKHKN